MLVKTIITAGFDKIFHVQLPHGEPRGGAEERGQLRHLLGAHEGGAQAALRASLPQVSATNIFFKHLLKK